MRYLFIAFLALIGFIFADGARVIIDAQTASPFAVASIFLLFIGAILCWIGAVSLVVMCWQVWKAERDVRK